MYGVVVVVVDFGFFFLVTAESSALSAGLEVRLNNLQQKQAGFSLSSFQREGFLRLLQCQPECLLLLLRPGSPSRGKGAQQELLHIPWDPVSLGIFQVRLRPLYKEDCSQVHLSLSMVIVCVC